MSSALAFGWRSPFISLRKTTQPQATIEDRVESRDYESQNAQVSVIVVAYERIFWSTKRAPAALGLFLAAT